MRVPSATSGSVAGSSRRMRSRPASESASPAMSSRCAERSRSLPWGSRRAGFSAPLGPTRSSFMSLSVGYADQPPSITTAWPVMKALSSEAR